MAVRYLFNTNGEYVAFVKGDNIFAPNSEWLGFIRNGNEFYQPDGQFSGYVLQDDRVARKRGDRARPRLLRPMRPLKPLRPLRPLRRLRMARLPSPYEDLFLTAVVEVPTGTGVEPGFEELEGARLIAADNTYLGTVSRNAFDPESLANQFGNYGNQFNRNSVFNEFGTYGSQFSHLSPNNQFSHTPPRLVVGSKAIAFLTTNAFLSPRVDPQALFAWMRSG